ncbi:hypothetical protein CVD28_15280 [Bacillus sp. M6-12]|nr:hypothetical protein CVD28_15280 [Bacillus sp. M6-12]
MPASPKICDNKLTGTFFQIKDKILLDVFYSDGDKFHRLSKNPGGKKKYGISDMSEQPHSAGVFHVIKLHYYNYIKIQKNTMIKITLAWLAYI